MKEVIPNAIDFAYGNLESDSPEDIAIGLIEFARLHVKAALKAASESSDDITTQECVNDILNSYPLENIK